MGSSEPLFDDPEAYDAMLDRGIGLTGEGKGFFVAGRIAALARMLPGDFRPARILDFGCGVGDGVAALVEAFPGAAVFGADSSEETVAEARRRHGREGVEFLRLDELPAAEGFDLVVLSGVMHHVAPGDRPRVLDLLRESLVPGGRLAIFENNPYNPGTRWVMARIPFDRDAVPLRPGETRRRMIEAGFVVDRPTRFLFFFPRFLAFLRPLEAALVRVPLGGQYGVMGKRPR